MAQRSMEIIMTKNNEERKRDDNRVIISPMQYSFDYEAIREPGFWQEVGVPEKNWTRLIKERLEWLLYKTPLKGGNEQVEINPVVEFVFKIMCSSKAVIEVVIEELNKGKDHSLVQEESYYLVNLFQEEYGQEGFAFNLRECTRCWVLTTEEEGCRLCELAFEIPRDRITTKKVFCFCTRKGQFCTRCIKKGYAGRQHYTYLTEDGPLGNIDIQDYCCYKTLPYRRAFYRSKVSHQLRCETCFRLSPWEENEVVSYDMRCHHVITRKPLTAWCDCCLIPLMEVSHSRDCGRCEIEVITKKEILLRQGGYRVIKPWLQMRIPEGLFMMMIGN